MTGDALTIRIFDAGDAGAYQLFQTLNARIYAPEQLPLKKERINEQYLLHSVVVFETGKPVGHACLYHNPHLRHGDLKNLLVGNFEAIADAAVARLIFSHAEAVARNEGFSFLIGPINGSTWDDYRLPLDAEPPLFFTENPSPGYYPQLFALNGFKIIGEYVSGRTTDLIFDTEMLRSIEHQLGKEGLFIREINIDRFEDELIRIHALCNIGFQHNFLYTPILQNEFVSRYLPLQPLLDPAFVLLAENGNRELQALYLCLPDSWCRHQKQLVIKTIVKHPQCGHKGLMAWLGGEINRRAHAQGYTAVIHAFMHETARSNRLSERFGGTPYRRYALYGKAVPALLQPQT